MKPRTVAWMSLAALVGCAGRETMGSHDVARNASGERGVEREVAGAREAPGRATEPSGVERAPAITLASPVLRGETRRIGAPAEPHRSRPPGKRRLIDVALRHAELADALRFIADAGGFNMVLQGDPSASVTLELHRVDAFDALVTVAEAHGLVVDIQRGIVLVTPPLKTASNDEG
jgi:hypothetical protein